MDYIIYKLTNKINNKFYIGITSETLNHRWKGHCRKARFGSTSNLHQAIRKYGEENWSKEILFELIVFNVMKSDLASVLILNNLIFSSSVNILPISVKKWLKCALSHQYPNLSQFITSIPLLFVNSTNTCPSLISLVLSSFTISIILLLF